MSERKGAGHELQGRQSVGLDEDGAANRTLILYSSKYGTTRRYAEWIAEETGAELADASSKKWKYRDLEAYDTIVYGGGIYSGGIKGIELITKNWSKGLDQKRVIVFAVGIAVDIEANRQQCMEINFEKRLISWMDTAITEEETPGFRELVSQKMMPISCFFLPGAYDPARIRGLDKMIMKLTRKMIGGGAGGQTAESSEMIRRLTEGCDLVDRSAIEPLLQAIRMPGEELFSVSEPMEEADGVE